MTSSLYEESPQFGWRRNEGIRPILRERELGLWPSADDHTYRPSADTIDVDSSTPDLIIPTASSSTVPRTNGMLPPPPLPSGLHGSGASLLRRSSLRRSYVSRISPLQHNRPQRRSLQERMNGHEPQVTAITSINHRATPRAEIEQRSLETSLFIETESSSPSPIPMSPRSLAYLSATDLNHDPNLFPLYPTHMINDQALFDTHSVVPAVATQLVPTMTAESGNDDSPIELRPYQGRDNSINSSTSVTELSTSNSRSTESTSEVF
jgi:hypothetical protein